MNDGYLEVDYPNGSRYKGEWEDGKYHGQGVFTWLDGGRHEGEFEDGLPNGQGVSIQPDGNRYEGEFKDGNFQE